jgi:hypothetical protein
MARKRRPFLKSVAVYWRDATFSMDKTTCPLVACTMGFLLEETDAHVLVASEQFEDGTFRQHTSVPKGMLLRMVRLRHVVPREVLAATQGGE